MAQPKFPKMLALAAIAPFLVGFAPPEESGTHVSVSAGQGRFVSSPGCARPRLVDYADQQVGVYHRMPPMEPTRYLPPTRIGFGVDFNRFGSREKECTQDKCANPDTAWHDNAAMHAVSPYLTLDWKWAGLGLGAHAPLQSPRGGRLEHHITRAWLPFYLKGSVRLGLADKLYFSADIMDGQPLNSGGRQQFGLGGRLGNTELWLGVDEPDPEAGLTARASQGFGPFRLRLTGVYSTHDNRYADSGSNDLPGEGEDFKVGLPDYSLSAGIDYHLPW